METTNNNFMWVVYSVGAFLALFLLIALTPFTIVNAGERAVVLKFGAVDRVLNEGIHWVTPFVEDIEKLDVRTQKEQVTASAASKDLQNVSAEVALNFNLVPEKVGELWKNIGEDYKVRIIDPAIQEAVKAATAKYTAEELVTKRELVRDEMKSALTVRLTNEFISVTEVSIVDFNFSAQFNTAIEAKVTAEQNALAAKNKLEQIKFEAEQRIATAKAEAESIRLQSDAANNERFISLKKLEVQMKLAERWNGQLPQNMYANTPVPLLDLSK